jgi:hypothetical protein
MALDAAAKGLQVALTELRAERDRIDGQIGALENALSQLGVSPRRRRGRPKGSVNKKKSLGSAKTDAKKATKKKATKKKASKKKAAWSDEKRAAARKRMQDYWAKRKAATKKKTTKSKK